MAGKREKPEDIVSKLRQAEVLQEQAMTLADAMRQIGGYRVAVAHDPTQLVVKRLISASAIESEACAVRAGRDAGSAPEKAREVAGMGVTEIDGDRGD